MDAMQAANYWKSNRQNPPGWKCVLAGGENYSAFEIGEELYNNDGSPFGIACGETGAVLVPEAAEPAK